MNVVLHNCTEVFITASNKPKRFACINQYHFSSAFKVFPLKGLEVRPKVSCDE